MALELHRRAELAGIRRVGIPRALMYYRYGIAWRTFFQELGCEVVLDAPSDRGTLEVGDHLSVDECCLASKLFLGHVAALVEQDVDAVFVPSLMGYGRFDTFCTKFQALPDLVENAFAVANKRVRVISLRIDELKGETEQDAYLGLAARLGASRKDAKRAYRAASAAQRDYDASMAREQERLIKSLPSCPSRSVHLPFWLPRIRTCPTIPLWAVLLKTRCASWVRACFLPMKRISPARSKRATSSRIPSLGW